ncbi:uncharacterized protein LOC141856318 [Brevipalpus obovatus]|uniref:uncharacterized protein LOC141856318 n=1 Tax=Brevipalpus obovatus TaxID=246614 RepID=UPI003D9EA378
MMKNFSVILIFSLTVAYSVLGDSGEPIDEGISTIDLKKYFIAYPSTSDWANDLELRAKLLRQKLQGDLAEIESILDQMKNRNPTSPDCARSIRWEKELGKMVQSKGMMKKCYSQNLEFTCFKLKK